MFFGDRVRPYLRGLSDRPTPPPTTLSKGLDPPLALSFDEFSFIIEYYFCIEMNRDSHFTYSSRQH